jgi:N-acyl-L-homoserine lactone synthetase
MSAHNTLSKPFNDSANILESARQVAVSTASSQAAVISAEITYFRSIIKLAQANGISPANFNQALQSLGVMT